MSGLFGTFNIATRGLFAQQRAIDTTSHNIANANTEGYSRQRVTLKTSRPFPMPSLNNAVGPGQLGTGVDVASIDRIRDSFLDYQVRVEMGVNGQFSGRDKFLSEIENIMNEPTDTGISSLIGKFFDSWNTLATSASKSNAKSIVAQQSLALTNELNHSFSELESLKKDTQTVIKDTVFDVNSILNQLGQINQQIKQVAVSGNHPNDLMDKRDLLLDQLSNKFGIKIDKRALEGIDVTTSNDSKYADVGDDGNAPRGLELGTDGKPLPLNIVQIINPEKTAKFSYIDSIVKEGSSEEGFKGAGDYTITYYKNGDKTSDDNKVTIKVAIKDADQYKKLNECRVIWANNNGVALKVKTVQDPKDPSKTYKQLASTDKDKCLDDASNLDGKTNSACSFEELALFQAPTGELKGYMSVQNEIDNYETQLNKLAKALAFSVNSIMSQSSSYRDDGSADGKEGGINNFFVNGKPKDPSKYTADDEKNITAANITINAEILKGDGYTKIKTATSYDINGNATSGESDGARALAVQMLRDSLMGIQNIDKDGSNTTTRYDFLNPVKEDGTKIPVFVTDSKVNNLYVIKNNIGGMTLDSYFKDTVDRLGIQEQEAKRMVGNQAKLLAGFTESRDSVSGVSLDEEMANLVQFQHCYQANAKIISTVDQLLDVIVNGLRR